MLNQDIPRPRAVTVGAILLIVAGALALLGTLNSLFESASMAEQGALTYTELLLQGDPYAVGTPVLGVLALIAGIGLLRRGRAARALAAGLGGLSLIGAVWLVVAAVRDWSQPGSFAVLLLPPAVVALLFGAALLYTTLSKRSYFSR